MAESLARPAPPGLPAECPAWSLLSLWLLGPLVTSPCRAGAGGHARLRLALACSAVFPWRWVIVRCRALRSVCLGRSARVGCVGWHVESALQLDLARPPREVLHELLLGPVLVEIGVVFHDVVDGGAKELRLRFLPPRELRLRLLRRADLAEVPRPILARVGVVGRAVDLADDGADLPELPPGVP